MLGLQTFGPWAASYMSFVRSRCLLMRRTFQPWYRGFAAGRRPVCQQHIRTSSANFVLKCCTGINHSDPARSPFFRGLPCRQWSNTCWRRRKQLRKAAIALAAVRKGRKQHFPLLHHQWFHLFLALTQSLPEAIGKGTSLNTIRAPTKNGFLLRLSTLTKTGGS